MLKKIVAIGPESTGKSTLCSQLAKHFNTCWCPEFARAYLDKHGTNYTFENLLTIAKGQLALEKEYEQSLVGSSLPLVDTDRNMKDAKPVSNSYQLPNTNYLFIDTDQYVMKVWCEYVFNRCHTWILNRVVNQRVDLYLLCKPDLAWAYDPMREYPDERPRQELYHIYKDILINQQVPWCEIKGNFDQRLQLAVHAVNNLV